MTRSALVNLASRKLASARNQAVHHLEALRKAVEVIKQAERRAEHQISLDWSLVKQVNVANSQVQKAGYLTTLKLSEKAAAKRDEILRTARQTLEAELKARANAREKARQAVKSAIDQRDLCKSNADTLLCSIQIAANQNETIG